MHFGAMTVYREVWLRYESGKDKGMCLPHHVCFFHEKAIKIKELFHRMRIMERILALI